LSLSKKRRKSLLQYRKDSKRLLKRLKLQRRRHPNKNLLRKRLPRSKKLQRRKLLRRESDDLKFKAESDMKRFVISLILSIFQS